MLTLITGPDRVSLTRCALQHIKDVAGQDGSEWILVVPEQFSFEAEKNLCCVGGDTIGRYAEVLSFSRLSDRVASKQGGIADAYLDKGGQLLTMALAAEQVVSRIKLYASVLRKPEFLADMVRMVGEFKSYCLDPRVLLDASKQEEGQFAQKLEELAILYEAYLAICANGKADPADKLLRLMNSLEECEWIKGLRFCFDGFSDFTEVELRIIEILMRRAQEVRVMLPLEQEESALSHLTHDTSRKLENSALQYGVTVRREQFTQKAERDSGVQALLENLFSYGKASLGDTGAVKLCVSASVEEECRAAAMEVKRLLAADVRCRDISVACTDMQTYEVPLKNAFQTAGVSCYFAGERGLLSKSIVSSFMNSLFAACGAMTYEDVAVYLKSGLPLAERKQCDRLDNYAHLWNLCGNAWDSVWTLHPRGFAQIMTDENREYLQRLNYDRAVVLQPLLDLRKGMMRAKNTGDMVMAAYEFLENCNLRERLETRAAQCEAAGQGQAAQELTQIYELLIQALEQTWLTLGQTERGAEDFCRLFQLVLTQYQVATIPAGLDQVHISDLPDLRYRQTEHLLVLGACDGKFPSYRTAEGLLTEEDRIRLIGQGVSIAPGRSEQIDQELNRIGLALLSASRGLYLSYSGDQPAWLFRRAAAIFPVALRNAQSDLVLSVPELAAWKLRHQDQSACTVEGLEEIQTQLMRLKEYHFEELKEQTVQKLYGSPILLSPSKIDKFAACQFAFFMNYGLKAKPRKQAKLDQPAFGTYVHAVLEHTVLQVKALGGFGQVTREQILEIAAQEIARYADEFFPEQASRDEYLFRRSIAEIREIVEDLWEELRRSRFQPEFCELKFSDGEALPPVTISGEQAQCQVIGMVDRVDLFRDADRTYVRVVDYKTGSKDFDYTDILNGAGLQMLIYLFALQTSGKTLFGAEELIPAGVLYVPAKKEYPLTEPMPEDITVQKEHRDRRRRKGLIRSDEQILAAMEENPEEPLYMPYKLGRDGLTGDLATEHQMKMLEKHVTRAVAQMADQISGGAVTPNPIIRGKYTSCDYCDYKTVCHKDLDTQERRILAGTTAAKFWEILEQEEIKHG